MQSQNDSSAFDKLIQQALAASQRDDSDTALRLFAEASQQYPESGIPHFLAGAEYAQMGKIAEAEASFASAVLLAPGLAIARFQLGLLQFTSARAQVAMMTWQPLLQASEDDPLRLFVEGFAELAQDHFVQAIAAFEKGIAANNVNPPLNGDIQRVIAEIHKVMKKNNQAPAEETREESEDSSHFLLGTYRQNTFLH